MQTVKNKTTLAIAISAAAMISGLAVSTTAQADETKGKCMGANECKGQTACATAEGSCAGTNSCAGKGWIVTTEAECAEKGGEFEAM
ncbi:BufA2 family periplasmic bufferin-type metallophore [Ostreibacterium oceani]|uniref:Integral membrane protein DUF2282 n=1 Tax=Ostreibacterium oceani TaxID=2654998 RepID=A0A6N7ETN7_9GAMM|nr:hypothetical protein [Ostreibacterium oceani]MPV85921.1 hypothetical protein [Ostreibacterium oceani]